ncbi:MAG: hypothetical protein RQ729_08605 [Wenzhouxiangellaceae bacterium]|nr:hypothetical protein [Wenzhouxiangellaceae bacterium]
MSSSSELPRYSLSVTSTPVRNPLLHVALHDPARPEAPGLECLGGDFGDEYWAADDQRLTAVVLNHPDPPDADAAIAAEALYCRLIDSLRDSDYPYPLRLWNYFPAINQGGGDQERYRRFCIGRGRALEAAGLNDAQMCAATAIGGLRPEMRLIALCGRDPGVSIENPRQVSAWNYPRRYGPRQPAFARATALVLEGGRIGLLVSGTASVVGHATTHPHDALAQTDEAASNLDALLAHASGAMNRPTLAQFNDASLARVYVRHAEDWPAVRERLRQRWPTLQLCGLVGDICRADLMVEIEAWHAA